MLSPLGVCSFGVRRGCAWLPTGPTVGTPGEAALAEAGVRGVEGRRVPPRAWPGFAGVLVAAFLAPCMRTWSLSVTPGTPTCLHLSQIHLHVCTFSYRRCRERSQALPESSADALRHVLVLQLPPLPSVSSERPVALTKVIPHCQQDCPQAYPHFCHEVRWVLPNTI